MHVMMDIQAAVGPGAGVGRYVRSLLPTLAGRRADGDRLSLFYFDFQRQGAPTIPPGADARAVRWIPGRVVQKAWKTLEWPPFPWFSGRADLYHFPNFIRPPLPSGRSVVTIHDAAFLRHPDTLEPRNLAYLTHHIRPTVERAGGIITNSMFTADELHNLLGVPRDKLHPIPLGLGEHLAPPSSERIEAARRALGLTRPYLLHVGTLEPRKNLPFLAEVFERLDRTDLDLVLAGPLGWRTESILARLDASPVRERIRRLDRVPEEHLAGLYGGALLYVCPTLYEGFGFTPLEAMQCGVPVVAARVAALPEVLGDAPVWVDAPQPDAWVETLRTLLADPDLRRRVADRGPARATMFSWDRAAAAHWDAYRKVVS